MNQKTQVMSLREFRKLTPYSQQEVADHLGIKQRTLSDWEKGKSTPPSELVRKLAGLYDVSPTQILMACELIKK
jgi:transcriptional regulator with XRE-family HTH domain